MAKNSTSTGNPDAGTKTQWIPGFRLQAPFLHEKHQKGTCLSWHFKFGACTAMLAETMRRTGRAEGLTFFHNSRRIHLRSIEPRLHKDPIHQQQRGKGLTGQLSSPLPNKAKRNFPSEGGEAGPAQATSAGSRYGGISSRTVTLTLCNPWFEYGGPALVIQQRGRRRWNRSWLYLLVHPQLFVRADHQDFGSWLILDQPLSTADHQSLLRLHSQNSS